MVYSVYPNNLDSSTELPIAVDNITPVAGEIVNRHRDAIIAIEAELGIKPAGTFSTTRARLDSLDIQIAGIISGESAFGSLEETLLIGNITGETSIIVSDGSSVIISNGAFITSAVNTEVGAGFDLILKTPDVTGSRESGDIVINAGDGIGNQVYGGIITVSGADNESLIGGSIRLTAGALESEGSNYGGDIELVRGTSTEAGGVIITAGTALFAGAGGELNLVAGNSFDAENAGLISLKGGDSEQGIGGGIEIEAGSSNNGTPGNASIEVGIDSTLNTTGKVFFKANSNTYLTIDPISTVSGSGIDVKMGAGSGNFTLKYAAAQPTLDQGGYNIDITGQTGNGTGDGGTVSITGGPADPTGNAVGGPIVITGGTASPTSGGGGVYVTSGAGGATSGGGGPILISSGDAVGDGVGGNIQVLAGDGRDTGVGGNIQVIAGDALLSGNVSAGGQIVIASGDSYDGIPGDLTLTVGSGTTSFAAGKVLFTTGGTTYLTVDPVSISQGSGVNLTFGATSGDVFLTHANNATPDTSGSTISIGGQSGFGAANGGEIEIEAGNSGNTSGNGGNIDIGAGAAIGTAPGVGGQLILASGDSSNSGTPGDVKIRVGKDQTSDDTGKVLFDTDGATPYLAIDPGSVVPGSGVSLTFGETVGTVLFTKSPQTVGNTPGSEISIIGQTGIGSGNGGLISIVGGTAGATGNGGEVNIISNAGGITSGNGGPIIISSGNAPTDGAGGLITVQAGNGGATGDGGTIIALAGDSGGGATGNGGGVQISSGNAVSDGGDGGEISIVGGTGGTASGDGGEIEVTGGTSGAGATGNGGAITVTAGNSVSTSGSGGNVSVQAGLGTGASDGGSINLMGGGGSGSGLGGYINIVAGSGADTAGNGGGVTITGGSTGLGATGNGGEVGIYGGGPDSTNGNGGDVGISGGEASGNGAGGDVVISPGSSPSGTKGIVKITGNGSAIQFDSLSAAPITPASGTGMLWVDDGYYSGGSSPATLMFTDNNGNNMPLTPVAIINGTTNSAETTDLSMTLTLADNTIYRIVSVLFMRNTTTGFLKQKSSQEWYRASAGVATLLGGEDGPPKVDNITANGITLTSSTNDVLIKVEGHASTNCRYRLIVYVEAHALAAA